MGGFRDQGLSRKESRQKAGDAAASLTKAMMADPDMVNDSKKMNDAFTAAGLTQAQGAGAMQALKDNVMSDPDLGKAGNLRGLLGMHGKAREGGDAITDEAKGKTEEMQKKFDDAKEARKAQETERGDLRKKLGIGDAVTGDALKTALKEKGEKGDAGVKTDVAKLEQLEEAGAVEKAAAKEKQGFGDVGDGKGGDLKIGGTLTLLDNGQAQLEGQAGGAPGGGV
jgi:hypothetical protein